METDLVTNVLSHLFALLLHLAVFVLAPLFGLLDGLQSLTLGLFFLLFGVAFIAATSAEICNKQMGDRLVRHCRRTRIQRSRVGSSFRHSSIRALRQTGGRGEGVQG